MMDDIKPRLVVSQCLGFAACRWNGVVIPSEIIDLIKPYTDIMTVCPEVEIGLGVPRNPIRIVGVKESERRLVQPDSGKDFTNQMNAFTSSFLQGLQDIDGFVLKSKSPSCGIKDVKIYPNEGKAGVALKDRGFFGGAVLSLFPDAVKEDDTRLTNFRIREHFLLKLFTLARFRWTGDKISMKDMVSFHTRHKFIFMAYHQKEMKTLGQIVANKEKRSLSELTLVYKKHLLAALERTPAFKSHINVLMHALGYISKKISPAERAFFLKILEDYRNGNVPLSVPVGVMKSHLVRFQEQYLLDQFYFNPFPSELVQITDSGKGRKLRS